ncbi:MAG TPA: hypothetical protein VM347_04310, partial [Nonomuraea sp.]|nr:hypothetical protein [Nonomuraea sp.]
MLARFTDSARRALIRAGTLALDAGRPALTPDLLLLALAEIRPFSLDGFTMTAEDVRGQVDLGDRRAARHPGDRSGRGAPPYQGGDFRSCAVAAYAVAPQPAAGHPV